MVDNYLQNPMVTGRPENQGRNMYHLHDQFNAWLEDFIVSPQYKFIIQFRVSEDQGAATGIAPGGTRKYI
jgi:hypothetical protein